MGFYAPAQIVRDAREHGVEVRAVDVNHERVGLHARKDGAALRASACARSRACTARPASGWSRRAGRGLIASVEELRTRGGVPVHAIERLAAADAFRSIGLDRRAALWDARALKQAPDLPLFAAAEARDEGAEAETAQLPAMPLSEHVVTDYQTVRLSA